MKKARLHIIAACTDRKRSDAAPETQLRNLPGGKLRSLAADWWRRVSKKREPRVPARELYAGDHWSTVLKLPDLAGHFETRLWVASAGYGLIPADCKICSYGATFSQGSPDSVSALEIPKLSGECLLQSWWQELAKKRLDRKGEARTVAQLAAEDRKASLMIVAGPRYLIAMEPDVKDAVNQLLNANKLIIVSSPHPRLNVTFGNNLVPSTAKLQTDVGGARAALHARVAAKILRDHTGLDAKTLRDEYESLSDELPPLQKPDRAAMSDKEVQKFVRRQLKKAPQKAHSPMLRILRDSGRRCEQSRFRRLYEEVRERGPHG